MLPKKSAASAYPVFLVRHGETESNLMKRYAGRGSEPLTKRGRQQASRVAQELHRITPTIVYSSRIARARETAEIIAAHHGVSSQPDGRLDELLMGPWEGLSESEVVRLYPREWELWCRDPHELSLLGRETLQDVADRMMLMVIEASLAGPSILVTHVAPIRVVTLTLLGLSLRAYKRLNVPNASCIRIDIAAATALRYPSGLCVRSEVCGPDSELAIA
jgi:broad specificity phosphatase PhoE